MITVRLEPAGKTIEFDSLNTVTQLLNKLGKKPTQALVILRHPSGDRLLTPDISLRSGDVLEVRNVTSSG